MVGTRCTTWHHKPCVSMNTNLYTTAILTSKIACVPIAFLAEMMGDVMYLHQALRQPDAREFMEAVIKEVNGHIASEVASCPLLH